MSPSSPNITELKVMMNEQELIQALDYHADPNIPGEAAEALGSIGGIPALEPLCRLMEDADGSIKVRLKAVTAIGNICVRVLKVLDQVDPDSLSNNELRKHQEEDGILSWVGSRLKLSMKAGSKELRKAAGSAYMILPLEDDSVVLKAFSKGSTKTFQSTPTATDASAHIPDESDSPSAETEEEIQSIADDPENHSDDLNDEAESEPEARTEVQTQTNVIELSELNLDEPVEIAPNTYWVARREGTLLERNIYLRIFSDGENSINMLIDPGPPEDLTPLIKKLSFMIGGLKNIHLMFLNHQDPDVSYNAGHLQKLNPDCVVLCSEDSWRLVKFYGLNPNKYKAIEQFKDFSVKMSTGQRLRFIPSPYCHSRGAVMLYDEETGVLFTGDFLGGLSFKPDLFATEDSWDGISTFHQIYMPSQAALLHAVSNIRDLDPVPKILAPQHGSIITGDLINDFLERIERLEVGLDLFLKERSIKNYIAALNELIAEFGQIVDPEIIPLFLKAFLSDGSFPNAISIGANGIIDIHVDVHHAVDIFLSELRSSTPPELLDLVDISIMKVLTIWKIPIPDAMVSKDTEETNFFMRD